MDINLLQTLTLEISLREVSANGRYWENGQWIETTPLEIKLTMIIQKLE